jgi:hypothetical protein
MKTEIIKNDYNHKEAVNYDGRQYYNAPCTIIIDGVKYVLSIGSGDRARVVINPPFCYVVAENSALNYISLTLIDTENKHVSEVFLDGNNIDEHHPNIFEHSTEEQIKILSNYIY